GALMLRSLGHSRETQKQQECGAAQSRDCGAGHDVLLPIERASPHGGLAAARYHQRWSRRPRQDKCRAVAQVTTYFFPSRATPILIRGTGVTEYLAGARGSLCLDVEGPDHVAPLLCFAGDELAKVGWRVCEHVATQIRKPRLHLGIGQGRVDLRVELVDDLGGRSLRCADAEPDTRVVAGQDLADRRNIWQFLQACETG